MYDYAWYSGMSAADPASCCFATTCRAHPIHLWDACTGELRCSYRAFDDNDEVRRLSNLCEYTHSQLPPGCDSVSIWMFAVTGPHLQSFLRWLCR